MGTVFSSIGGNLLVVLLAVVLYMARRAMLPKPLAGIPYNRDAANKMLGDIPEMVGYIMRTKRIFCWLTSLTARHQSAITQVFVKPASLPWVVVTDPFEAQDILLRRKEFDRTLFYELIGGIIPEQHSHMLSSDARFKYNRSLINHLMAPTFISQVSAPEVYKSICTLIKVLQAKCDIAKGRPFSPHHDIVYAALDAIFSSSFGLPEAESITIHGLEAVSQWKPDIPSNMDVPVKFPDTNVPEMFDAILTIADSVKDTQLSPAPILSGWVLRQFPYMKKAIAIKDNYIRKKAEEAAALIESGDYEPRSAMHSVLLRERELAGKEGRRPDYYKRAISDEFLGFAMAGYDTSATATAWGVKMLTDNPNAQEKLRVALRDAFPQALKERRAPSYQELSKAHIPYLDAVVEEVLRHANAIGFVARKALEDTTVLGHHIPKGTEVLLVANGAGYLEPSINVPDTTRSPGARRGEGKTLTGSWDDKDIGAFRPERWLKTEPASSIVTFDPTAGPQLAFGLGPRSCFGKRLALQALKMQFALITWHFKLLPTPPELSGYDAVQKFAREPIQCYYPSPASVAAPEPSGTQSTELPSGSEMAKSTRLSTSSRGADFEQHLIDHNIYLDNNKSSALNIQYIRDRLRRSRPSLSLSRFSNEDFQAFKRSNATIASEDDVVVEIVPVMCGTNKILSKRNLLFTELEPITDETASKPKPDVFDGACLDDIDKRIRADEHIYPLIIPTKHVHVPVAPNFFLEVKGQSGDPAILMRQACYDGANGARAMHCLQNYGREEPIYDGNAYTFSATYHPGTRTLALYAHHPTAPASSGSKPEYHLTDLPGYYLMSDRQALVDGLTAFRNLRDMAQEFRDGFIRVANAHTQNLVLPYIRKNTPESLQTMLAYG
ncbi:hypothetical protein GQX73_g7360 [Xylaria multiplex]|uniref:Cytochrome P450 n=1 Tax=Xylaria multiplex TaxID=323545 RepID=A0A7C8MR36_9PEZI|nr:hypothetical protein GQX73_g7360 [Xylaria multiplex]